MSLRGRCQLVNGSTCFCHLKTKVDSFVSKIGTDRDEACDEQCGRINLLFD